MSRGKTADKRLELLSLLQGELDEESARRLRKTLAADEELRSELDRLQTVWQSLELPSPDPAPDGFAARVVARAFESEAALVPVWFRDTSLGRLATAAALAAGIALGVVVAYPQQTSTESADWFSDEPTLAESYWQAVSDSDSNLWTAEQQP